MNQNTISEAALQRLETFIGLDSELQFLVNRDDKFSISLISIIRNALNEEYCKIEKWHSDGELEMRENEDYNSRWFLMLSSTTILYREYSIYRFRKHKKTIEPEQGLKSAHYYKQELEMTKKILNDRLIERDKTILELSTRVNNMVKVLQSFNLKTPTPDKSNADQLYHQIATALCCL